MTENNQSISPNSVGVHQLPASLVINEPGHEGQPIQMYGYVKKEEITALQNRMLILETTIKNLKFLITILTVIFTIIAAFAKIFQ
ncbi:hypothetical protein EFN85_11540 [Lactococcus lactis]|uniref:hypothetical protein n=1 Tax=Lactococcus lactis TaxID=1358 RepID=UPI0021A855A0|nr:hypothetical protein [Lactococcus lactis]MCT3090542.1 hypothetical protein [Lactococcus lactis]